MAAFCPSCGQQIQWSQAPAVGERPPSARVGPAAPPRPVVDVAPLRAGPAVAAAADRPAVVDSPRLRRIATPLESPKESSLSSRPTDEFVPPPEMLAASRKSAPALTSGATRRVAPVWRRAGAWAVDLLLLSGMLAGFLWLGAGLVHHGPPSRESGIDWLAETTLAYAKLLPPAAGLFALLSVAYLAVFTALGGQTIGKRAFGLQVVDARGRDPGLLRSGVRSLLALGSGALMFMGFWLVVFDRRRQALHDKLVGTYVVLRA